VYLDSAFSILKNILAVFASSTNSGLMIPNSHEASGYEERDLHTLAHFFVKIARPGKKAH
jgi:hypothetical protein